MLQQLSVWPIFTSKTHPDAQTALKRRESFPQGAFGSRKVQSIPHSRKSQLNVIPVLLQTAAASAKA